MKKIITMAAVAVMIICFAACSKDNTKSPTGQNNPSTKEPYTELQGTVWEGTDNSNQTTVKLIFWNYPDGSFLGTKPGREDKTGEIIWEMSGSNISVDLYEHSNITTSFSGTYKDSRLILNGIIFSRK